MSRRWAPRSASTLAAGAALLFAPPRASAAEPEPVRFAWVRGPGADGCSSQPEIARQVTARLGRSPFSPDAARTIDAYVTRGEAGWRSEIYVREGEGEHPGVRAITSDAPDCSAIESATVLALALAIDPVGALRPPAVASPPPPIGPPSPALHAVASPLALPPPREGSALPPAVGSPRLSGSAPPLALGASGFALRGGVGLGLLPRPAASLSLTAQVAVAPWLGITAEALWIPEVSAPDPRFAFGLSALAIGACADVTRSASIDLAVCGAAWGGALHAVVRGLVATGPGDRAWAAASANPRLRVRLASHVHLELGAHVFVPLLRRPFVVTGWSAPVFQETSVAALPFVGVGANFP